MKTKLLHCNKRTILLINEKREREKETLGVKNYKERWIKHEQTMKVNKQRDRQTNRPTNGQANEMDIITDR